MTPCHGSALGTRPYRRRLAAAVCASALLHFSAVHRLVGGPAGAPVNTPLPAQLTATLVPRVAEEPAAESLPLYVESAVVPDALPPHLPRKPSRPEPRTDAAAPE